MEIKRKHIVSAIIAVAFIILDITILFGTPLFAPLIVFAITIGTFSFWTDYFKSQRDTREIEERFPDFVRNLVGAIKSGMPAPQAIVHVSNTDYGALSKHVKKLANQVEWSIPLHKALLMFANDTKNFVIRRSISTVIEAEMAGGNIEDVLESVTSSVVKIKKIKEKRRASIHSQVIQSYIIFFVFLGIMVVIQNLLIPYMQSVSEDNSETEGFLGAGGFLTGVSSNVKIDFSSFSGFFSSFGNWVVSLNGIFLMLAIIQGLFAGLVLGKLSEGNMSAGIKHSLILVTIAILVMTFSQGFV
jgi:archaeal flagellar protein FlaJ